MNEVQEEYYSPVDFEIGKTINVYGRNCVIYSCDDFTKAFYKNNLNVDMEPISVEKGQKKAIKHEVPPYTGYGSP